MASSVKNMTKGRPVTLLITFALPLMLGNVFQQLYTVVDTAVVGQALGADDYKGAKATVWKLMFFSICTCFVMGTLLILLSPYIPRLYSGVTQDLRSMASSMLVLSACAMPLHAFAHCSYFTLRSGGKTVITFLFDCLYTWVVPVPLAYCMAAFTGWPVITMYFVIQFIDIVKVIIGALMLRSDFWANNVVEDVGGAKA